MTTYTIEEGIPIPECDSRGKGGSPRQPMTAWTMTLDALQPGQSTFTEKFLDAKAAENFRLRRPEKKYVTRKVGGQGWRVWRVE